MECILEKFRDTCHICSLLKYNIKNHESGQPIQTVVLNWAEENENNIYYQDSL